MDRIQGMGVVSSVLKLNMTIARSLRSQLECYHTGLRRNVGFRNGCSTSSSAPTTMNSGVALYRDSHCGEDVRGESTWTAAPLVYLVHARRYGGDTTPLELVPEE